MSTKKLVLLTASAALTAAQTPAGFAVSSDTEMVVAFDSTAATDGVVVEKDATSEAPIIALLSPSTSSNLAIMMIDLDIPASINPDGLSTVLHWLQTNLSASSTPTTLTLDTGSVEAYVLSAADGVDALAEYKGPSPPAMEPLSHRYTQVVLDMSSVDASSLQVLADAAETRLGFDAAAVLEQAGITEAEVVAGNFFNVTNADSVEDRGMDALEDDEEEGSGDAAGSDGGDTTGGDDTTGGSGEDGDTSGGGSDGGSDEGGDTSGGGSDGGSDEGDTGGDVEGGTGGSNGTTGDDGGSDDGGSDDGGSGNGTIGGGVSGNGTDGSSPSNGTVPVSGAPIKEIGNSMFAGLLFIAGAFLGL